MRYGFIAIGAILLIVAGYVYLNPTFIGGSDNVFATLGLAFLSAYLNTMAIAICAGIGCLCLAIGLIAKK